MRAPAPRTVAIAFFAFCSFTASASLRCKALANALSIGLAAGSLQIRLLAPPSQVSLTQLA